MGQGVGGTRRAPSWPGLQRLPPDSVGEHHVARGLVRHFERDRSCFEVKLAQLVPAVGGHCRIELDGPDAPGLILRIAEVFGSFGANIVRMNSERIPAPGHDRYVTRFAVHVPDHRVHACLATVANTAGEMRLSWRVSEVENGDREIRNAS